MGFPCDEILGNHSKGLPGRFYTHWAGSRRSQRAGVGQKLDQSVRNTDSAT